MRLGVLDVGSNTVHLLVVDAHPGARPLPASSHKEELRLAEHLTEAGEIDDAGADALVAFVVRSLEIADDQGVERTLAFATSAIREAPNGEAVLARVKAEAGLELTVLDGPEEAALTFLAVRRWFGWSAGTLLVLDVGGGSFEVAAGMDERPDVMLSAPLGAGRLTRALLTEDPPGPDDVRAARRYIRAEVAKMVPDVTRLGAIDGVVGTSKTIRSLARICGSAPADEGVYVERTLNAADLAEWVPKIAAMTAAERAALPGVSASRASQLLAGALVVDAAMDLMGIERLRICPWALREGVILRTLDQL